MAFPRLSFACSFLVVQLARSSIRCLRIWGRGQEGSDILFSRGASSTVPCYFNQIDALTRRGEQLYLLFILWHREGLRTVRLLYT